MKSAKNNNRPTGRPYEQQRPNQPRVDHPAPGDALPRPARGRRDAAQPPQTGIKAFLAALPEHMRSFTPVQTAIVCAVTLVCGGIIVALAFTAGSNTPVLGALSTATPAPLSASPSGGTGPSASATPLPALMPDVSPTPTPDDSIIRVGETSPTVVEIQKRLMNLGYMEEDEPTDYFGSVTSLAVSLFQRQHKLVQDGSVGTETYALLMSADAQSYTVMEGDSGSDVRDLQDRLRELGYLDSVSGKFGDQTTKAVKTFQQTNGLTTDGKIGQKTSDLLYSDNVKPYFAKFGEQSDKLKSYQKRLNALGYLTTTPDGRYGKDTVAAVKRFQEINGIIADGFLGPNTVKVLLSAKAQGNALVLGMQGNDVQNVQKLLKTLGYISHVTGYFGSETQTGVEAFQKHNGLSADGTVGSQTMSRLTSSGAKKATGGTGSSSSGGSSGGSSTTGKTGVEKLIAVAQGKLGKKYVWGSKGPNTFDCSGFVYYCLNEAGVKQGYLTSDGWRNCGRFQRITSISDLKRGDIVVFSGSSVGHVGIYLGNGSMIDASSSNGKVVKRSGMWSIDYWKGEFICGYRVF